MYKNSFLYLIHFARYADQLTLTFLPVQVLFIDDKQNNVDAAIRFGFRAFVYNGAKAPASQLIERLAQHGLQCADSRAII